MSVTRTCVTRLDASRFSKTPENYTVAKVNPTRIGVFDYWDEELGRIVKEFRSPEEVGNPESLASLNHKIVTDNHPPVMLDDENTEKYNSGHMTAEHMMAEDGIHTESELLITRKKLIKKVDDGKEQVSCGYTCDIDNTPGEYNGIRYDRAQKNIRYNHLAIVDRGRARTAALRSDAGSPGLRASCRFDAYEIDPEDSDNQDDTKEVSVVKTDEKKNIWRKYMSDYRFDGETYDVSEGALAMLKVKDKADAKERADMAEALDKAQKDADKARKDAEDFKAEADKQAALQQAKLDEMEEQIEKLKDIDARVDEREDLKSKAFAVLGKDYKTKGKTDAEIKMDVLKKVAPNIQTKLDAMPESQRPMYIDARFDGVSEAIKPAPNGKKILAAVNHVDASSEDEDDAYFDPELN